MIAIDPRSIAARAVLHRLVQQPAADPLLPLLALSVMATSVPFSACEVASVAKGVATSAATTGNLNTADLILSSCGNALGRCGASQQAADLLEARALLHWRGKRPSSR